MDRVTFMERSEFFVTPTDEELFDILRKALPSAYLSGGYVRDRLLGKDPKDMDFLLVGDPEDTDKVLALFQDGGIFDEDVGDVSDVKFFLNYNSGADQACVVRFWYKGREVNILRSVNGTTSLPEQAVMQFNFTMNQVWVETDGIFDTELFVYFPCPLNAMLFSARASVWNAVGRPAQPENLLKYRGKFPDWRISMTLDGIIQEWDKAS